MIMQLPPGFGVFERTDGNSSSGPTVSVAFALWVTGTPDGEPKVTKVLCYAPELATFVWRTLDSHLGIGFLQQPARSPLAVPKLVVPE